MVHNKLFIPGPVEVMPDILQEMARPVIGHRSKDFSALYNEIIHKLKKVLYTEQNVFLSTSSATGLWEAAARNCVENKCLNICQGAFSDKWYDVILNNGKEAEKIQLEWNQAVTEDVLEQIDEKLASGEFDALAVVHNETSTGVMNDLKKISDLMKKYPDIMFLVDSVSSMTGVKIEVDKLGIDVCLASVQKAFALPPGFSVCSVSNKAMEKSKAMKNRGYYFDFQVWQKFHEKAETHTTPSISHMYAMKKQLENIFKEGLEKRFERHRQMASIVQRWTKDNFELFAPEGYRSITVTTASNNKNIVVADMIKKLQEKYHKTISNGYSKLKEKTFRIAHMGDFTTNDIKELLDNIDDVLKN